MFELFRTLSLRYLRRRWPRSVLIAASIALGVATLVSTRVLNQCVEAAAAGGAGSNLGNDADLLVVNDFGVPLDLADDIRARNLPGVRSVQPLVLERVSLPELGNRPAVLIGAEISEASVSENPYEIHFTQVLDRGSALKAWTNPVFRERLLTPVSVGKDLFDQIRGRRASADEVTIQVGGRRELLVIGAYADTDKKEIADLIRRSAIMAEVHFAARLTRPAPAPGGVLVGGALFASWHDRVSRIDVFLEPGANPGQVRAELQAICGNRGDVVTREEDGRSSQQVVGGIRVGLSLCAIGALVVGLFLVSNVLSVSVAERRHDIGVLRSMGATRWQIAALFAAEATLLGIVGALLGLPLGVGLAQAALRTMQEEMGNVFLGAGAPSQLGWGVLAAALIAGVATALLAALIPAIRAAADEPADAVRRAPVGKGGVWHHAHRLACVGLVAGGVLLVLFRGNLPSRFGTYGGLLFVLTGMLLAMPFLVEAVARLVRPLAKLLLGVESRLAADNLLRAPARTGVVIGALAAGVALLFQVSGVGKSNEEPVIDWLDRVVTADLFVMYGNIASAVTSTLPMSPDLGPRLAEQDDVERVIGLRYAVPKYGDTRVYVVALDAVAYYRTTRERSSGTLPNIDLIPELATEPNAVLVSENFAYKFHVKAGDTIHVRGPDGDVPLRVLGAVQDYTWSQGTIIIDRKQYAKLFQDDFVDMYHIVLKPGVELAAAKQHIAAFAARENLTVEDRPAVRQYLSDIIRRLYNLAYLQQMVVAVVASLGVVTALLISVIQRRRELGLLRAVGATRPQVLRSVLAEATLMGLIGTALGILIGLPMEWYILRVVLFEESGFLFDVIIPWREALGIAVVAVAVATLAGLVPALQACRLRIAEAIAYE